MEVKQWAGGLYLHEVKAINTIKQHFQIKNNFKQLSKKSINLADLQKNQKKSNGMFPWKGYAGFRLVNKNKEGEFDLVIITHCNVIIVELKDWNNGKITANNGKWYLNDKEMGKSPVSVTKNKEYLLKDIFNQTKYKNKFTNEGYTPHIHFVVVMTGNADFSQLPNNEKPHVLTLKQFLEFKDEKKFNNRFRPHPNAKVLNQDFHIFDDIFGDNNTKPKSIRFSGYTADEEAIFNHPNKIYSEYVARSEVSKNDKVLLRKWDFSKVNHSTAQTPTGRFQLVTREYEVLHHIKEHKEELYKSCLTYKNVPEQEQITVEHIDLFEILPSQHRFNEFVGKFLLQYPIKDRLDIVKLLLNKFAQLHDLEIAHRDVNSHSIWLANDKKVTLSGFATAYFPKKGTIGDIREVLSVSQGLADKLYPIEQPTAYQQDIQSLAVISWHILQAKRLSDTSLKNFKTQIEIADEWFYKPIINALHAKYANAQEFYDDFCQSAPNDDRDFSFDTKKLEPFYRDINHSRAYREDDDMIIESSEKEVYISNGQFVKAWLNVYPIKEDSSARILYQWLNKISELQQSSPNYLAKISDFGIATKSSSLFLVSEYLENGILWDEFIDTKANNLSVEQKLTIINNLIHDVEHLHGLNIYHGDLHPKNIMLLPLENGDDFEIKILDILDYNASNKSNLNLEYCPETAEDTPELQRDIFAVIKMSCELLANEYKSYYDNIIDVFNIEKEDKKSGFISFDRFKDALTPKKDIPTVNISIRNYGGFEETIIYPEEGELFIQLEESRKSDDIVVKFLGLGGIFTTFYSVENRRINGVLPPLERDYIARRDKDNATLSLSVILEIIDEDDRDFSELDEFLFDNEKFQIAIKEFKNSLITQNINQEVIENDKDEIIITETIETEETTKSLFSVKELWQAILETETEALPYIVANDELIETEKEAFIPYNGEISPLDQFKKDDIVQALGINDNDKTFIYGNVDIKKSTLNELHLKPNSLRRNHKNISENSIIYLQSKQSKISFRRRKNALSRILDSESIIQNLFNYFDESCSLSASNYGIELTEEDFQRYDRQGDNNKTIRLNQAQRVAFDKLLNNGPLSLLQGPPGTGKTEFISAFVHYLFEKQNINNVLLVSQSHEAVNTAAERIQKHCQRLNTELDIVRFSNRENAVSDGLKHLYSENLQGAKYQVLAAQKIASIQSLASSLGLDKEYISIRANLHFDIENQAKRYQKLTEDKDKTEDADIKKLLSTIKKDINNKAIQTQLIENAEIKKLDILDIFPKLIEQLNQDYAISALESSQAQKIINLNRDMLEALVNEGTNYDEFLARSRQLVVGTCVGIGQSHIGIADNMYDWVIIDEAARSISSELAIAMQSGKRILLVGDHKQLPPLYSQEHKNALARKLGISKRDEELDDVLGSDFERVFTSDYGKMTCATLKTQYRMAPAIGSMVSACFYEGELENGKTEQDIANIYQTLPIELQSQVTWLDTSSLPNAYHTKNSAGSFSNDAEAKVIINLLKKIANNVDFMDSEIVEQCLNKNEQAIGIICMYAEQKRIIRKKFRQEKWSEEFQKLVKIDTVDSYQGKENRIIILSITRYDKESSTGFLKLPNRINVALSRAMDRLVIVGAKKVWESPKNRNTPFNKVLTYIQENKQNNSQYSTQQLKSVGSK